MRVNVGRRSARWSGERRGRNSGKEFRITLGRGKVTTGKWKFSAHSESSWRTTVNCPSNSNYTTTPPHPSPNK